VTPRHVPASILVILFDASVKYVRLRMFFSEGTRVSELASRWSSAVDTSLSNFVSLSVSFMFHWPPPRAPRPEKNVNAWTRGQNKTKREHQ